MTADLRHSLRTLLRSPGFLILSAATLAVGIASASSIFSLFYQALLRALPASAPRELVLLHSDGPELPGSASSDHSETTFSYPMYLRLRDTPSLRGLAARSAATVIAERNGSMKRMRTEVVSGNYFSVLGLRPRLGRLLAQSDDSVRGGNRVAVLSHDAWVNEFGSDPNVVGRKLTVNSEPFEIVGVSAQGFRGILAGSRPDLFVPISMKATFTPGWNGFDRPGTRWLALIARLGAPRETAQADLQPRFRAALSDYIEQLGVKNENARQRIGARSLELRPAAQGLNEFERQWRKPLVALMAMVALLLAIAAANVANLFLARAVARERELAVRMALGARRAQAASLLVAESAIVALLGTVLGIALTPVLSRTLLWLVSEGQFEGWIGTGLDLPVLAFASVAMFGVTLLCGAMPAWEATRKLTGAFGERGGSARIRAGLRKTLVGAQVALSLALLAGASFFAKSLLNLLRASPGFEPRQLMALTVDPTPGNYTVERGAVFYRDLRARFASLPGVESVSLAEASPFSNSRSMSNVAVESYRTRPAESTDCDTNAVGPAYFRTIGTPIRAGRDFDERDLRGTPRTAIVNESFVRRFALGSSAVGRRMSIGQGGPLDIEIVGVVADSKNLSMREKPEPTFYVPHEQAMTRVRSASVLVRLRRPSPAFGEEARSALKQLDPTALFISVRPMETRIAESMTSDRLLALLASAFGTLATLLTALGLYGVISYLVTRRTAEFGVRMALGAVRSNIVKLVMGEAALVAAAGAAAGIAAALAMGRVIESQLFGLRWFEPLLLAGVLAVLAVVVLSAAAVPALRAARIEPVEALRRE